MPDEKNRKIVPTQGGLLNGLTTQIRLIARLMTDSRVSPLLKLLPVGTLAYFLIPDLVLGPIDDVAVVWLGTYLFVELAPPDVVEEHLRAIAGQPDPNPFPPTPGAQPPPFDSPPGNQPPAGHAPDDDVIEGEFWETKD